MSTGGGGGPTGGTGAQGGTEVSGGTASTNDGSGGSSQIVTVIGGLKFSCRPLDAGDTSGCPFPGTRCNYTTLDPSSDPAASNLRFPTSCSVDLGYPAQYYPTNQFAVCYNTARWVCEV
jgi:hypothetical protein